MPFYPLQLRKLPCIEGTQSTKVLSCAKEINNELVVIKTTFDGFHDPKINLNQLLVSRGKKFLFFFCGIRTSVCILFTISSAYQLGFFTVLVNGCTADYPNKHDFVVKEYSNVCFECVELEDIINMKYLETWRHHIYLLPKINDDNNSYERKVLI